MTAITTRIVKDARPLMLPWCAVALAGALPLVYPIDWTPLVYLLGFLVVPLLATLSLGEEFQHRTISLLLSQPVGRMKIWAEKLSVTVMAVVSAVLVFSLAMRATAFHPGRQEWAFAGAWIVAIIASSTFWTLFTRSTVGGFALNIGIQSFISFTIPWTYLTDWLRARGFLAPGNLIVPSLVTFIFLCYAGGMLWLGARMLARFEATGGVGSGDLLIAGPDVMPGALAAWLRSRPTGAVLNLIRKELRLLRPVWLISLLAALVWACLTLFGVLFERGFSKSFETVVVSVGVAGTLLIAILAGSMSLGEECTSGTHAWHLTLPVSAFLQWRIKLYMALFAGVVGAGLLPMLIAGKLFGSSRSLADIHLGVVWLFAVLLLTFAAFWCACAANGTVRAVQWVIPAMLVLSAVFSLSEWAGEGLTDLIISRFDPFADFKFTEAVISGVQSSQIFDFVVFGMWSYRYFTPFVVLVLVPILILAIIQSYRMFRTQPQGSLRSVARNLLPLALLIFLCNFPLTAFDNFVFRAWDQEMTAQWQTLRAVEKIRPNAAQLDAAHPLQLSVEDLAKASPLSEPTVRWLRGSRITVVPLQNVTDQIFQLPFYGDVPVPPSQRYLTTIRIAGGAHCTRKYPWRHDDLFMLIVVCE